MPKGVYPTKKKKKEKLAAAAAEENGEPKPKLSKKAKEDAKTVSVLSGKLSGAAVSVNDCYQGSMPLEEVKGLSKLSIKVLKERGFDSLLEVQHKALPSILEGRDTVGRAKTGCGKTLAFVLPIVERIVQLGGTTGEWGRKPLAIAMAPTRELAKQIHVEFEKIASVHKLVGACLYGGTAFGPQCEEIRSGIDAVVATPGRILDHCRRETVSLKSVKFFVLDEADEMLSMGFQDDVEEILSFCPTEAQKMLFSATMPNWVQAIVSKHLKDDLVMVDVVGDNNNQSNVNITHQCIPCSPFERGDTLADLCKVHAGAFGKTLVFTDTKKECDELAQNATLCAMGAGQLHGDIPQNAREVTMENFRNGKIRLLIATDVAARGLDVPNVDLVVMCRPPADLDNYVHRSGRTARGGRSGTCCVFYTRNEEYLLRMLQRKKGITLKRRGPPQPSEVVAQAARDAVRQVDHIHQDNVDAFAKVAEEMLAERGSPVFLLSACLAAMTGYTAQIKSRSLLTCFIGFTAILMKSETSMDSTSKAWYLLRKNTSEQLSNDAKAMQLSVDGFSAIFDVPQAMVDTVLKAECWKGVKFSVATELPDLQANRPGGFSAADDEAAFAWQSKRRWDKINSYRQRESEQKQATRDDWKAGAAKGTGRGFKRRIEDGSEAPSGRGGGRGAGGGRGGGGRGRGF